MFALLALILAIYTAYAAATGRVWIAQGPAARRVSVAERPAYFWICIFIYAGLAFAMAFLF